MYSTILVDPSQIVGDEQLGTKTKFWFARDTERWLFKEPRANTGEDWAEKVVAEIAGILRVPAARVELAAYGDRNGSASLLFLDPTVQTLVHGNELLAALTPTYEKQRRQRQRQHTLSRIFRVFEGVFGGTRDGLEFRHAVSTFCSFLVLDAVVGNTDRHHENWGLLALMAPARLSPHIRFSVAPSFDHASSLGRELSDAARADCLAKNSVGDYALRGRGGIYIDENDPHGANPIHLVHYGWNQYRSYFEPSIRRLREIRLSDIVAPIEALPPDRMSKNARAFAIAFVTYTHHVLGELL
jgi:hypothetical protein